jgi:hypothetical protein
MPLIFFKALSDKKYECFYPRKLTHDVYGWCNCSNHSNYAGTKENVKIRSS